MAKITISDLTSAFASTTALNAKFQQIEDELNNKVLYRDEAGAMARDLDMATNRILNLPVPLSDSEPARLKDVQNSILGISTANLIENTPSGNISSTNVQAAINELDEDKLQRTDSFTTLRAITPVDGESIYVRYHTTKNDGGHGIFEAVTGAAPGTYTDDNGITILPTGGDGSAAWVRIYSGDIYIEWFGLVADNSTDNLTVFNSAIAHLVSIGGGTLNVGKYDNHIYTSAAIKIPSNITINIDRAQNIWTNTATTFTGVYPNISEESVVFLFDGEADTGTTTTFSVSATTGDNTATVASVTGFAVGNYVLISDNTVVDNGFYYQKEINRILGIAGSVITFEDSFNFDYALTSTDLYKLNPCENSAVIGGDFDQSQDTINSISVIGGQYAIDCEITGIKGKNLRENLVKLWYSTGIKSYGHRCEDAQVTGAGEGYGTQYLVCRHSSVGHGNYKNVRHAVDFSGGSQLSCYGNNASYVGSVAGTSAYSMGHGLRSRDIKCHDNFSLNYPLGVLVGNPSFEVDHYVDVSNNTFIGCTATAAIFYTSGGTERTQGGCIIGNTLIGTTESCISVTDADDIEIGDNHCLGTTASTRGMINLFNCVRPKIYGGKAHDSGAEGLLLAGCTDGSISDVEIKDAAQQDIIITTHSGSIKIDGVNIACANTAFDSVTISGATGAGHLTKADVTNVTINGQALRTSGINAIFCDLLNINGCNINTVTEGIRADKANAPKITANYIDTVTNGIRLLDDATDVMTTYYSAANVITNASGSQILNSAVAAAGTLV